MDIADYDPVYTRPSSAGNGEPGVMTEPNADSLRADFALYRDIDWEGMAAEQEKNRRSNYRAFWSTYRSTTEIGAGDEEKYEEWASRYNKVKEVIKSPLEFSKVKSAFDKMDWFWSIDDAEMFLSSTEDEYASRVAQTYAFIDLDGNWKQKGEMGWFGIDDKSNGTENYDEAWWKFVRSIPGHMMVYVVDCHI